MLSLETFQQRGQGSEGKSELYSPRMYNRVRVQAMHFINLGQLPLNVLEWLEKICLAYSLDISPTSAGTRAPAVRIHGNMKLAPHTPRINRTIARVKRGSRWNQDRMRVGFNCRTMFWAILVRNTHYDSCRLWSDLMPGEKACKTQGSSTCH